MTITDSERQAHGRRAWAASSEILAILKDELGASNDVCARVYRLLNTVRAQSKGEGLAQAAVKLESLYAAEAERPK